MFNAARTMHRFLTVMAPVTPPGSIAALAPVMSVPQVQPDIWPADDAAGHAQPSPGELSIGVLAVLVAKRD